MLIKLAITFNAYIFFCVSFFRTYWHLAAGAINKTQASKNVNIFSTIYTSQSGIVYARQRQQTVSPQYRLSKVPGGMREALKWVLQMSHAYIHKLLITFLLTFILQYKHTLRPWLALFNISCFQFIRTYIKKRKYQLYYLLGVLDDNL